MSRRLPPPKNQLGAAGGRVNQDRDDQHFYVEVNGYRCSPSWRAMAPAAVYLGQVLRGERWPEFDFEFIQQTSGALGDYGVAEEADFAGGWSVTFAGDTLVVSAEHRVLALDYLNMRMMGFTSTQALSFLAGHDPNRPWNHWLVFFYDGFQNRARIVLDNPVDPKLPYGADTLNREWLLARLVKNPAESGLTENLMLNGLVLFHEGARGPEPEHPPTVVIEEREIPADELTPIILKETDPS